ncbi:hypothetical protein [Falsibacillus pallidus]|uniref:Uncharacterized protein n=1 Tax=Falsibacillus pallidus TaxID=493781 RepID=A0A370GQ25_9BACI|nr:hypothetical protein [Falsibacillus pallidus]RDI45410.1 hypothetical protein DFR59_10234 [Falsibacillus pallidus]
MNFITKGKEVILFDKLGTREDLHIVKCRDCGSEFRTSFNSVEINCSSCHHKEKYNNFANGFEVIGLVENSYRVAEVSA